MSDAIDWIGLHIHYNSDMQSLLGEGVRPALAALREDGLITGGFLIRYWEQGPHIRVRLRPAAPGLNLAAEARFREIVEAFLLRRPSMYSFPGGFMLARFNDAYRREYGDDAFEHKYGAVGRIPFAANNTIQSVAYEPELDRYAGALGMRIAETLFEASTIATLDVLASPNGADPSVRAGHALKFLVLGCSIFLQQERWAPFLQNNQDRWTRFLNVYNIAGYDDMMEKYARQRERLLESCAEWAALLAGTRIASADEAILIPALRDAADALRLAHASGALDGRHQEMSLDQLMEIMLSSYLHMHCNRLGMLAMDEIYLSILGREALTQWRSSHQFEAA